MRKTVITAAILTSCAGATTAMAADLGANTTVGGEFFADFSHIQLENQTGPGGAKVEAVPSGNGLDVKRFYLIVDHRFNEIWSADFTSDAQFASAGTTTVSTPGGGTANALTTQTTSGGVTELMIKKLYLEGAFSKGFAIHIGAYTSPWAPFVESLYGYRYIEKTSLDRLGYAQTADWGVNATGVFGANLVNYSLSVVEGAGYKNPTRTKDVDVEGRLAVNPVSWLTLGAGFYSGHLGQINATNNSFPKNTATRADLAVGVHIVGLHVGGEWYQAKNFKTVNSFAVSAYGTSAVVNTATVGPVSDKATGFSSWVSYDFTDQWQAFARFDDTKLSANVNPNLRDEYWHVGAAFKPIKPIDIALVVKNEKVEHGSNSVSGGDANGSYTIGGSSNTRYGWFHEYGVYVHYRF
jgi:hypothetical protein